jgi:Caspase domain
VTPIVAQLPPVTAIGAPLPDARFFGDSVDMTFTVRSPSGLAVDGVQALIDGRPVEARGVAPAATQSAASPDETRHMTIPAPAHDFELALIARSGELVGEAARVRLVYAGTPASDRASVLKPKLYAVAIGVGDYADETLRLTYPAADARGFADALQKQKGGLYSDVEVRTILDKDATRANVLDALDWLDTAVTSRDIGMVLIAGHGLTDEKGRYWFLPADAATKRLSATAVSQEDIRRDMSAIAGKAVLFLDTCHANRAVAARGLGPAGVDVASLVNDFSKTENGLITFAASQGAELSQESPAWGHGAFSLALVEGIGEGKADLLHKGTITVSALDAYIVGRVKDLTEGHQHPVMSRPDTVPDFAFATAR